MPTLTAHGDNAERFFVSACLLHPQFCLGSLHLRPEDVVPIFREEFELNHSDIIGYYDGNELVAFTLAYRFQSVNSVWADQFAWNYQNKKLSLGHVANKSEIALYKRLGYDYYYLGESSDYKAKLDGYEISDFFKTWQTTQQIFRQRRYGYEKNI